MTERNNEEKYPDLEKIYDFKTYPDKELSRPKLKNGK